MQRMSKHVLPKIVAHILETTMSVILFQKILNSYRQNHVSKVV